MLTMCPLFMLNTGNSLISLNIFPEYLIFSD